jgi:hypothetical protein
MDSTVEHCIGSLSTIEEYAMQSGIKAALTAPIVLAFAGFATPGALSAQTVSPRPSSAVRQLGALSRERAQRWAEATPAIHCAPAPLTERPAAAGEAGRPHVAPLEEAFFDAAVVKRTFAARDTRRARQ